MPPRVIAHVDLDAFFAAVEQRDNPALRGRPVVVGADPRGGKGRGVVSTCSYEARKFGIRSAMPVSEAFRRCPSAVFLPPDFSKYSAASREVFKIFYDFTPHIEAISIDEAFLDITTSHHLFGTPHETAQKLKARINAKVGLTASVGLAPVKMVAKIASDYGKPDGLTEVPEGEVIPFLAPLPIRCLWGVGPRTQETLERMGIKTIGDMAKMPVEILAGRFGEQGRRLHHLANGIDPREVVEGDDVKSVSHEHTFERDTSDKEVVLKILLDLSEQVSRRLRKYGLKGKTVTVKIRLKGFETHTRAHTLPARTNFTDVIYQTARRIFEGFYKKGMSVRLIGARVSNFDDPYVKESLFTDPQDTRREKIHQAVDLIKDKFGDGAIHRAI